MPKYIKYCLSSGMDKSHMLDCNWFDTLKDAKDRAKILSPGGNGCPRSYKIERFQWTTDRNSATPHREILTIKLVESNFKVNE